MTTTAAPASPFHLFVSYAHADRSLVLPFLKQLEAHLGCCTTTPCKLWIDTKIACGQPWDATIRQQLAASDLRLLFISPSFQCSRYIQQVEKTALLDKAIAIGLKVVDFRSQLDPDLAALQIYRHIRPQAGETFFSQCGTARDREAFIAGLYQQILQRLS